MINVIVFISCSQNQDHTAAQIDDIKILSEEISPSIADISQVPNASEVYESNPSTTLEETDAETEGETEETFLPKGSCGFDYTISSESSIDGVHYPTDFTVPDQDDEVDSIASARGTFGAWPYASAGVHCRGGTIPRKSAMD